jgi:hypothetical protein
MTHFHPNQFAFFAHEASDSDDSGYVEDDPNEPTGDHVDLASPARIPPEQVDQENWGVVRPGFRHTRRTAGSIVRHVDFHHFPRSNANPEQGVVVNLPGGGQILQKSRYFLIVGRRGDPLVECPIFTYDEKGLRKRVRDTWPEYCSIRSLSLPVEGFMNQSPNNEVLDVMWEKSGFHVKQLAVVRLSELRYRDEDAGVDLVAGISFGALQYARQKVIGFTSEAVMITSSE